MPMRIQLRRSKGWRMPPGAVKVDRSTKWGNPFVVGRDGDAAYCVDLYKHLLCGRIAISAKASTDAQRAALAHANANIGELRGKHLACWCRQGAPCHADVLIAVANSNT